MKIKITFANFYKNVKEKLKMCRYNSEKIKEWKSKNNNKNSILYYQSICVFVFYCSKRIEQNGLRVNSY